MRGDERFQAGHEREHAPRWFAGKTLENRSRAPALTAVLVIATGLIGAVMVTPLMNALGIRDYAARGFAVGLASHGIGTARAFSVDPVAGTFAGIAMGLNALLSAVLVPLIVRWVL